MGCRVGMYIRELRGQCRVTIRWLGSQVGVSPSYVSLVERGQRRVSIAVLYPIVRVLGGDMLRALILLAQDAGVPPEVFACGE